MPPPPPRPETRLIVFYAIPEAASPPPVGWVHCKRWHTHSTLYLMTGGGRGDLTVIQTLQGWRSKNGLAFVHGCYTYCWGGNPKLASVFGQIFLKAWNTVQRLIFWRRLLSQKPILISSGRHSLNFKFMTVNTFLSIQPLKIARLFFAFPIIIRVNILRPGVGGRPLPPTHRGEVSQQQRCDRRFSV